MRFGLYIPCYGQYADPRRISELAGEIEAAGWDGLFISDHLQWLAPSAQPVADPWILLAAMAMTTRRIRLGILVTPIARRRGLDMNLSQQFSELHERVEQGPPHIP